MYGIVRFASRASPPEPSLVAFRSRLELRSTAARRSELGSSEISTCSARRIPFLVCVAPNTLGLQPFTFFFTRSRRIGLFELRFSQWLRRRSVDCGVLFVRRSRNTWPRVSFVCHPISH